MVTLQGHLSSVEIRRGMFGHHHKVQLVGLCCRNDVREVASAVAAEKRMHVYHAFELSRVAYFFRPNALGIQLLNRGLKTTKFVTAVYKWNLRDRQEGQQAQ